MICLNCGRENSDGVKFCCFCGAPAAITLEKPTEISPENGQLEISENDTAIGAVTENRDNESFFSQSPDLDALGQSPSVPRPGVIPANSEQLAAQSAANPRISADYSTGKYANAPTNPAASQNPIKMTVPIESGVSGKKNAPERKFTTLHIVMCLISTAVCAIAAGIFAGLYFSVV